MLETSGKLCTPSGDEVADKQTSSPMLRLWVFPKLIWILPLWGLLIAESALIASPQKAVSAHWRETPIEIDGQLDEPAWALAEPVSDFVQVEPIAS